MKVRLTDERRERMLRSIKEFFADYFDFPHQEGSSLNAAGIGYNMLEMKEAMERLMQVETIHPAA